MNRNDLIRKLRKEARAKGIEFSVDLGRGKGGHAIVKLGERMTTVKSGELKPGYVRLIRKQLGLD